MSHYTSMGQPILSVDRLPLYRHVALMPSMGAIKYRGTTQPFSQRTIALRNLLRFQELEGKHKDDFEGTPTIANADLYYLTVGERWIIARVPAGCAMFGDGVPHDEGGDKIIFFHNRLFLFLLCVVFTMGAIMLRSAELRSMEKARFPSVYLLIPN
ncbi:hypothetical protein EDC04DRAFT_2705470 [Pisolithus marmoratus]|nr:hypothetical protein EDC04DRAFT_2705470 [Pisolithus marmoratus]